MLFFGIGVFKECEQFLKNSGYFPLSPANCLEECSPPLLWNRNDGVSKWGAHLAGKWNDGKWSPPPPAAHRQPRTLLLVPDHFQVGVTDLRSSPPPPPAPCSGPCESTAPTVCPSCLAALRVQPRFQSRPHQPPAPLLLKNPSPGWPHALPWLTAAVTSSSA